jgi:hypothetical protein
LRVFRAAGREEDLKNSQNLILAHLQEHRLHLSTVDAAFFVFWREYQISGADPVVGYPFAVGDHPDKNVGQGVLWLKRNHRKKISRI